MKAIIKIYFALCKKTKSGLAAKCKKCRAAEVKIYMRKTRLKRQMKKLGLYNGTINYDSLNAYSKSEIINMYIELVAQFLKFRQQRKYCLICEECHCNNHKRKKLT